MLRLPRAAHYSICDLLCARDAACLSETASQWYQRGDPRHAAFFAALADRVARARGVAALRQYDDCYSTYLVPDKTIPSMIKYLEAVERLGSTKIVEQTTYMRCGAGSDPLTVESHEDIDGQVVARASSGMPYYGITSVAVAGKHVTQIEPHQPYHYVSYGLVVHEKELPGGRTIYYVAWPGITDVHPHLIGWPGRSSCRIVTKRPSWEPKPAWTPTQQKAIEKQAKRLAITDERRRALREYFETFIENEIDVLVMPALTRREWAELGVPLGHRARIKQAHKNRHPGMWAPGSP